MDRLPRPFVACGLGLLMAAAGCRATRTEVPPGRPFATDGNQKKAIEFSSEGHPISAAAGPAAMPNNLGGSNMASGIGSSGGRPDGAAFGAPPGAYGAPGSAPTADAATTRASGGPLGTPPTSLPPLDPPPGGPAAAPDLNVAPARELQPMPSQTVVPPIDTPGSMGSPNQAPSPM
jgi:hypothetical protein